MPEEQFDFGYNQLFFSGIEATTTIQTIPSQTQLKYPLDPESATSVLDALKNVQIDRTPDGMVVDDTPTVTAQTRAQNDYILGVFRGNSQDGLTEGGFNETITRRLTNTHFQATNNWLLKSVNLGSETKDSTSSFDWDKDYEFFCRVQSDSGFDGNGANRGVSFYWGLLNNTKDTANPQDTDNTILTTRHIGFFVGNGDILWASNADGTTQKITQITGITHTDENDYRIVLIAGNRIEFHINDELKVTHTANIPSGTTDRPDLLWRGRTDNQIDDVNFLLYNNYKLILS